MDDLVKLLAETGIPFAYDHFAEGESPEPPFICYLLSGSDNFSADGAVYFKAIRSMWSCTPTRKTCRQNGW